MSMPRSRWMSMGAGAAGLLAVVVMGAGWMILGADLDGRAAAPDGVAATVQMTDLRFAPSAVTIQSGETVTWRNASDVVHTVTADPRLAQDPSHMRLPAGAKPFHSGNVAAGGSFSHTFTTKGTYRYFCVPHAGQGMIATVVVE